MAEQIFVEAQMKNIERIFNGKYIRRSEFLQTNLFFF